MEQIDFICRATRSKPINFINTHGNSKVFGEIFICVGLGARNKIFHNMSYANPMWGLGTVP
jgi:hypothetical protein